MLVPLLFALFANDCRSSSSSTLIFKFSDDTTIEGLITNADESAYREEVERVVDWCTSNDLELNVAKTKEMIIDFTKKKTAMPPLAIGEQQVELMDLFKFLGTTIANTLKWDINAEIIALIRHHLAHRTEHSSQSTVPAAQRHDRMSTG